MQPQSGTRQQRHKHRAREWLTPLKRGQPIGISQETRTRASSSRNFQLRHMLAEMGRAVEQQQPELAAGRNGVVELKGP